MTDNTGFPATHVDMAEKAKAKEPPESATETSVNESAAVTQEFEAVGNAETVTEAHEEN